MDEGFDVTAGPEGGVALAVAVLLIDAAFTSACVMVRVAVHVVDAPGASVVDGHEMLDKPDSGSDTASDDSVTLPVFVTRNENVWVSPNDAPAGAVSMVIATDLVKLSDLVWTIGVVVDELFEAIAGPLGGVPEADAVLIMDPAFTSAWVMERVAVQVVDTPGAKVELGQETIDNPVNGSVTATEVKVTLPVLVMTNENVCVSPNEPPVGAVSVVNATLFVSVIVFV